MTHSRRRMLLAAGGVSCSLAFGATEPSIYTRNEKGQSSFLQACLAGQTETANLIIQRGLVLDLHEAAAAGKATRIDEILALNPGSVNHRDLLGATPFHYAVACGQIAECKSVARKGSRLERQGSRSGQSDSGALGGTEPHSGGTVMHGTSRWPLKFAKKAISRHASASPDEARDTRMALYSTRMRRHCIRSCDRMEWNAVRYLSSILANVALLLAFLQAPSLHVHVHEATERHAGGFFHTHIKHLDFHQASEPALRDLEPDDDAQFLNWYSAAPGDSGLTPMILVGAIGDVPAPQVSGKQTFAFRPNAHDPPGLTTTTPRAPPTV